MANDSDQAHKDVQILAEAQRIRDNQERSEAARKLAREKKKKDRDADAFAEEGSFASRMKNRRKAVESGDLEGAPTAFVKDEY